jgi:hypothetical protein
MSGKRVPPIGGQGRAFRPLSSAGIWRRAGRPRAASIPARLHRSAVHCFDDSCTGLGPSNREGAPLLRDQRRTLPRDVSERRSDVPSRWNAEWRPEGPFVPDLEQVARRLEPPAAEAAPSPRHRGGRSASTAWPRPWNRRRRGWARPAAVAAARLRAGSAARRSASVLIAVVAACARPVEAAGRCRRPRTSTAPVAPVCGSNHAGPVTLSGRDAARGHPGPPGDTPHARPGRLSAGRFTLRRGPGWRWWRPACPASLRPRPPPRPSPWPAPPTPAAATPSTGRHSAAWWSPRPRPRSRTSSRPGCSKAART